MEQARFWMWEKKKPDPTPHHLLAPSSASYGDSWEEQAFAEDAAGTLGGCVWPPRSYSCSFCRREFKSAQALGGHMNVHRRDRARLKQSTSNSPSDVVPQTHALNACTTSSFDAVLPNYSSQVCTFLYSSPNPHHFSATGPAHGLRVSSPPPTKIPTKVHYSDENISTLCFFSPLHVHDDVNKDDMVSLHPPSWSSFLSDKRDFDPFKNTKKKRPADHQDSRAHDKEDCVTDDHLSMSLNLQRKTSSDEEVASCKRKRVEAKPMSFLAKLSGVERCFPQSDVLKICSVAGTVDELDLELRLGNASKVK